MSKEFRPRGIRAYRGRSYPDLEVVGDGIRRELGLKLNDGFPALLIFENLNKIRLGGFQLEYGIGKLAPPIEAVTALTTRGRMRIIVSEKTYEGLERDDPRARFTFTHELNHVVLHPDEIRDLAEMPHAAGLQRGTHRACHDSEWQADAGAAAVLMPVKSLQILESYGRLDVSTVMKEFGVSYEAASYRVDNYMKRKELLLQAVSWMN